MLFQNRHNECILGSSIFWNILKTSKLNDLLHKAIELLQTVNSGLVLDSPQNIETNYLKNLFYSVVLCVKQSTKFFMFAFCYACICKSEASSTFPPPCFLLSFVYCLNSTWNTKLKRS